MNKFLIALLIAIISNTANSQVMNGIGEIRIGITSIDIIKTISAQLKKPIKIFNNIHYKESDLKKNIIQLKADTNDCYTGIFCPFLKEHTVYIIDGYMLMGKYKCEKLKLEFYVDKLYSFSVENPTFIGDFSKKYGDPIPEKLVSESRCKVAGESFNLDDESFRRIWNEGDIHTVDLLGFTRNSSDCSKEYYHSFAMFDTALNKVMNEMEDNLYKKCQEKEAKKDSIRLKDF